MTWCVASLHFKMAWLFPNYASGNSTLPYHMLSSNDWCFVQVVLCIYPLISKMEPTCCTKMSVTNYRTLYILPTRQKTSITLC